MEDNEVDVEHSEDVTSTLPVSVSLSKRSLSQDVPQDLIQGVPFRCLLSGGGRVFKVCKSPGVRVRKLLQRCSNFDSFISHDWNTSRWLKYGSLLILFNAKAAAVATLLVSITLAFLIHSEVLPHKTRWAMSIGYLTFVMFLFFWQNFRDILLKPNLAFLDTLTIPQEDEELKECSILGLAGFLIRSKKLVVLWSDLYVDRLWCIYELTTFMQCHGERPVQAIPVALPLLLLVHAGWWCTVKLLAEVVWWTSKAGILVVLSAALMFIITYPLQSYVGIRMTNNLRELTRKLSCFDVQEAKCSCCSQGHMSPAGETIPCDRELIYQSFLSLHGRSGESMQDGLERFNHAVRNHFGSKILEACGGARMVPLNLFVYVVFSMNTPFLIHRIPDTLARVQQLPEAVQVVAVMRDLVQWAAVFPSMLMYLWSNRIVWSQYHQWPTMLRIMSTPLVVVSFSASGLSIYITAGRTFEDSWLPVVLFLVLMTLGLCLLNPKCLHKHELPKGPPVPVIEPPEVPAVHGDAESTESNDSFSI